MIFLGYCLSGPLSDAGVQSLWFMDATKYLLTCKRFLRMPSANGHFLACGSSSKSIFTSIDSKTLDYHDADSAQDILPLSQ